MFLFLQNSWLAMLLAAGLIADVIFRTGSGWLLLALLAPLRGAAQSFSTINFPTDLCAGADTTVSFGFNSNISHNIQLAVIGVDTVENKNIANLNTVKSISISRTAHNLATVGYAGLPVVGSDKDLA